MDSRNTAFENHWASQWVDFDDTETTERRKRIAKSAFDAGWSASLTDEVLDSIHATAKAEALREDVAGKVWDIVSPYIHPGHKTEIYDKVRQAYPILADKQEPPR